MKNYNNTLFFYKLNPIFLQVKPYFSTTKPYFSTTMKIFFYNLSLIYQGRQRFCQKATKLLKDINIKKLK